MSGREAARRHVSLGALVREAVEAALPEELEARRAARQPSLAVLGAFDSGRSDIGSLLPVRPQACRPDMKHGSWRVASA